MAIDTKKLKEYGFTPAMVKKLTDTFGSKIKFTNAAGAIMDIAAPQIKNGNLSLAKTTPDNYDRVRNDIHDKTTGSHEKGARTGADLVRKPGDIDHGKGVFIKGIDEADLLMLQDKAKEILKGKYITLIRK